MLAAERDIPDPIKRIVRQRCGFGCVVCGRPIYEYHHMLGFATVQRHVAAELTLLCPDHHSDQRKGLLPDAKVEKADRDPYNGRKHKSNRYRLQYSGSGCEIIMGSVR